MIEFKHLENALAQYGQAIVDRYKTNLENSGRKATGELISSISSVVVVNGNEFIIELNLQDYWRYVEEGTKPHFPPVNKILEWIRVKPVLPTPMKNGKLPTEQQLAWMIAKKIERVGTEGTFDLEHTLNEVDYEQILSDAFDADVSDCLDEILTILK